MPEKRKVLRRGRLWLSLPENGMHRPDMGSKGTLSNLEPDGWYPLPQF